VDLQKVKPGDPLVIPAVAYNTFVDAACDYLARQRDQTQIARPGARHGGIVLVRNDCGADRGRFDVLGVAGAVFDPAADLDAFKNSPALSGATPSQSSHTGRFVVLLEPIATGGVGVAMASGVCPVRVQVDDMTLQLADVKDGDATCLKTSRTGSATILWRQSGTGTVWAVVKLAGGIIATHANPKVLPGSGANADTTEWDVDNQPAGYDGVQFVPFRLYWSGTTGDPVYQFIRTPTYDSLGRLVHVSAEVRTTAFATGPCQT
jgi:hypothetical protein